MTVLVEDIFRSFVLGLPSGCVFSTVRFEVTVTTERHKVVHVQSDGRVHDVVRRQVLDVMHLFGRSATVDAEEVVSAKDRLTNHLPFFGIVKCF